MITNESIMSQLLQAREEIAALRNEVMSVEKRVAALEDGKVLGNVKRGAIHRDLAKLRKRLNRLEDLP